MGNVPRTWEELRLPSPGGAREGGGPLRNNPCSVHLFPTNSGPNPAASEANSASSQPPGWLRLLLSFSSSRPQPRPLPGGGGETQNLSSSDSGPQNPPHLLSRPLWALEPDPGYAMVVGWLPLVEDGVGMAWRKGSIYLGSWLNLRESQDKSPPLGMREGLCRRWGSVEGGVREVSDMLLFFFCNTQVPGFVLRN